MRGAQNVRFVFDVGGVLDVRQMGDVGDVMFVEFGQMGQMPEVGGVGHQQTVFQSFEKRFCHRAAPFGELSNVLVYVNCRKRGIWDSVEENDLQWRQWGVKAVDRNEKDWQ